MLWHRITWILSTINIGKVVKDIANSQWTRVSKKKKVGRTAGKKRKDENSLENAARYTKVHHEICQCNKTFDISWGVWVACNILTALLYTTLEYLIPDGGGTRR